MRPTTDHQRRDLAMLTRGLILNVGAANLIKISRVNASALSKYGTTETDRNGNEIERHIPIDVLVDAEILNQRPLVLEKMAEIQGYRLVPVEAGDVPPAPARGSIDDADVLRAVKEVSDVVALYMAAKADGIDSLERRNLHREIDEAMSVLAALRKAV